MFYYRKQKYLGYSPLGEQGWISLLMGEITPIFLQSSLAGDEEVMLARGSIWWLLK